MDIEEIIRTRPDKSNFGGSAPWKLNHLYKICKEINPTTIIESGTWRGNSLWLFRNLNKEINLHSYEINYSTLMWEDNTITYHNYDIEKDSGKHQIKGNDIIFFDDHVNQKSRLEWSYKNGFKHIIFDDNVPSEKLHAFGMPPTPTISMLSETNELPEYVDFFKILDYDLTDTKAINNGQTYLTYLKIK